MKTAKEWAKREPYYPNRRCCQTCKWSESTRRMNLVCLNENSDHKADLVDSLLLCDRYHSKKD